MTASKPYAELHGRHILLGVTGGIAAYKSVELVRLLKKAGADVQVLMTPDASRFITPLTLGTVSGHPVLTDIFPEAEDGSWTRHISLSHWADVFVIAPATAQTLAKMAGGFCDNILTATALAARCPLLVCPAMDEDMLVHPATQRNMETLRACGHVLMPPTYGPLASGLVGQGRLPEPEEIMQRILKMIAADKEGGDAASRDLENIRVLVTAGPTREHVDPVRFLSNPSSGKMGFALAEAAARRGAAVTLICGPAHLETPLHVERINVESAEEMHDAVMAHREADIVIMAAAVADYAPMERATKKIKKGSGNMVLHLRRTPDILYALQQRRAEGQLLVGFAMETSEGLENARKKLQEKNMDWIVLNMLTAGSGFETETNRITLLNRNGHEEALPMMSKREAAEIILDRITLTSDRPAA
ncbi:MAG: bifunctional phosphopantothenoylcysteine decarboxylase/phosphopantothenate--cysteine ligase CoaBC [Bacteroidetes bacterium SB0662_bin_6]|nr:bifunctional phosphopantothenoylcysteine decarboxylase/phosphopantothenate--cysteine ligase CoaBC [Bacteroidetes bacterium SB0668_bin_1]MYE04032.1 bifunctional phosphopantothenoylcysteine decarboxylase/phosphopantothenate--cysteine ligase CoaBC [Bacteroidetes bacterium SB0662_bin_6]